jgi:hypothetical protein
MLSNNLSNLLGQVLHEPLMPLVCSRAEDTAVVLSEVAMLIPDRPLERRLPERFGPRLEQLLVLLGGLFSRENDAIEVEVKARAEVEVDWEDIGSSGLVSIRVQHKK